MATETTPAPSAPTPSAPAAAAAQSQSAPAPAAPAAAVASAAAPAGAPAAEAQKPADGQPAAEKAAEQPAAELKFPEGVQIDKDLLTGFQAVAKEQGLDAAKQQALANVFVARAKAIDEAVKAEDAKTKAAWAKELESDATFGGAKLPETKAAVLKALDRFDNGGGLRQLLEAAGLSEHPAVVRFAARAGLLIREDSIAGMAGAEASSPTTQRERLSRFYDRSQPKK